MSNGLLNFSAVVYFFYNILRRIYHNNSENEIISFAQYLHHVKYAYIVPVKQKA